MKVVSADTSATFEIHGSKVVESQLSNAQTITLALKQYSNPLYAGLREAAATNPADACIRAGRLDANIEVTLTETADLLGTIVKIRDYGCGMSREFLENNYFALGHTTAKGDERLSGGFGLGSKALLAIADMLAIRTFQNGYMHTTVGQLVDDQIRVAAVRSEKSDQLDGTEVTAFLPNSNIVDVDKTIRSVAVYVGCGSDYRGSIVLTVKASGRNRNSLVCDNEKCWSLLLNKDASKADYYSESVILLRKNVHESHWNTNTRVFSVGGERITLGVPLELINELTSAVVWNNAKYEVSAELCRMVTDELLRRGVKLNLREFLRTDSSATCVFVVCKPMTTLVTTSDRSSLRDDPTNVVSIADQLQGMQQEYFNSHYAQVAGCIRELNDKSECLQSKLDKLIVTARVLDRRLSQFGLSKVVTEERFSNIAFPLVGTVDALLTQMEGYGDLIYFLSHLLAYHHGMRVVGTTHYSNRKYGNSGWKSVTQFNSKSSREMDYADKLKPLTGYNGYTSRSAGLRQGVSIRRVIVVGGCSEKGGKQSIAILKNAVQSSIEECVFAVIYVQPAAIASAVKILKQQLKLCAIDLDVMTVAEYAESLGETATDRSVIAKSSRMIKDQLFIHNLDDRQRVRVDDISDKALQAYTLSTNIRKDYPVQLSVFRVPSDGEVVLDENGEPTKITLNSITRLLRVVGVCAVGVGSAAADVKLNADVVELSKDELIQRFWHIARMQRYRRVRENALDIVKRFRLNDRETREKLPNPPPYYKLISCRLYRSIQLVLGDEFRVRDLPFWKLLKRCIKMMSSQEAAIAVHRKSVFHECYYDSSRRHNDSGQRRREFLSALRLIMGEETERFLRRYVPDSFLARKLDRLEEAIGQLLRKIDQQVTCARLPYSQDKSAVSILSDAWDDDTRYMGDALQSVMLRQCLKELWQLISSVR